MSGDKSHEDGGVVDPTTAPTTTTTSASAAAVAAAMSRPGFGWASPPPSRCVVHEATVRVNMDGEFGRTARVDSAPTTSTDASSSSSSASSASVPFTSSEAAVEPPYSHALAGELLNSLSDLEDHVDPIKFADAIDAALRRHFTTTSTVRDDLDEFLSTGKSNGRVMKWHMMRIAPNTSFKLHAHPNIELIYVSKGTIHELRLQEDQVRKRVFAIDEKDGPALDGDMQEPLRFRHRSTTGVYNRKATDISSGADPSSTTATTAAPDVAMNNSNNSIRANEEEAHRYSPSRFLVNERGSVHLTYTLDDGAHLLVLWSGAHANIPPDRYPINAPTALQLPPEVKPF